MQFYSGPLMHFLSGVDKSTFLAKFTIVPIPIWLELEKDRPVRPHSGYSPSATATGSFATGTDGSNRSPSASESVVNERQIEFGEMRRGEFGWRLFAADLPEPTAQKGDDFLLN